MSAWLCFVRQTIPVIPAERIPYASTAMTAIIILVPSFFFFFIKMTSLTSEIAVSRMFQQTVQ